MAGSAEENELPPIPRILRLDLLITSEGETVQVTAMRLHSERIVISSAKFRAIPVVQFNSWLLEAVVSTANNDAAWQEEYVRGMEGYPSTDISFEDDIGSYKGTLWNADDLELRKQILESEHDLKVAGNIGQDKTIHPVRRNISWPEMENFIEDYVHSCPECQRNSAARHACYGLLQPFQLAYHPWDSISMDCIFQLLMSDGCSSVWVIIDCFSTMAHYIPLNDGEKRAADLVRNILKQVLRFHGLPSNIVSDRDTRYTSTFWSSLVEPLDIRFNMFLPFHPQADGQTEKVHKRWNVICGITAITSRIAGLTCYPWRGMLIISLAPTLGGMSPFFTNIAFDSRTNWSIDAETKYPSSQN
jgi:hypothetical protein